MNSLPFDPRFLQGELSIYVHIPFCSSKCDYCDFYSIPSGSAQKIESYIQNVCRELRMLISHMDRRPHSLYLGGGNPGLLSEGQLESIIEAVGGTREIGEVSLESNPQELSPERVKLLSSLGIGRLSVGIQSMKESNLKTIGRNGSVADSRRALELLGSTWEGQMSVDLITSIPGSGPLDTLSDIIEVRSLCDCDHLSIYDLTIEEGTALAKRIDPQLLRIDHGVEHEQEDVEAYLSSIGFSKYEVSNYCREKKRSLHNLQYFRYRPYIGIGPGASSTLFAGDQVLRVEASPDLERYLYETKPFCDTIYGTEQLEDQEILKELLMMGLRCEEGVDLQRIEREFGRSVRTAIEEGMKLRVETCRAIIDSRSLRLTRTGSQLANSITRELFDLVDRIGTVRYRLCT